jgi:hypothetical protein
MAFKRFQNKTASKFGFEVGAKGLQHSTNSSLEEGHGTSHIITWAFLIRRMARRPASIMPTRSEEKRFCHLSKL